MAKLQKLCKVCLPNTDHVMLSRELCLLFIINTHICTCTRKMKIQRNYSLQYPQEVFMGEKNAIVSFYLINLTFQYLFFSFTASVVIQCICYACNVQGWNRCFGCFPHQWRISRRDWTTTKTIRRCALQRSCVSAGRKITSNILWRPW